MGLWDIDGFVPSEKTLICIIVTALPQLTYTQGDEFDATGMAVTACFFDPYNTETNTSTEDITEASVLDPANGVPLENIGTIEIDVSYSRQEGEELNTKTTSFPVIVEAAAITAPIVQTNPASNVRTSGATLTGEVTADGGAEVTERGFVYSTSANPTLSSGVKVTNGTGTGVFTSTVSGLSSNTAYHVRAYAINSKGTSYGADVSFTTTGGGSSGGASTATLIVEGRVETQDKNYDVIYSNSESVTSRIGQNVTVNAPVVNGYALNDDATKTVRINTGTNTVVFWYSIEIGDGETPLAAYPGLEMTDHIRYIQGYPDGSVGPEKNITRAEAAAIFYRLIVDENKSAALTTSFKDVDAGTWYYQAVAYLEKHGILSGYLDGTFGPGNPITRAEFATIASRFDELVQSAPSSFTDVQSGYWAAGYINSVAAKGWITGFPDGTFQPDELITRAQAVTMVNRMLERKIAAEDIPTGANRFTDLTNTHWAYSDIMEASTEHEYERSGTGYEEWTDWE